MTRKIIAVCWDTDGVLVDTVPLHTEKKVAIAAMHGIALKREDWPNLRGISVPRVWKWLRETRGLRVPCDQFQKECEDYYLAHPDRIFPREGALEAFRHFESLRLPQCVVSSGQRREVDANLSASGVADRILFSLSADDIQKTKPDPDPYLAGKARLCAAMGWDAAAADSGSFLAIEDSLPGVTSAKRAGMTTILWAQTPGLACPEADYVVYTPADFLKVCREITGACSP